MQLSEAQMAALLNAAPDAIVIVDSAGKLVLVNAQAEALFGYRQDELRERPIEVLLPARFRVGHVARRTVFAGSPKTRPMGTDLELFAQRKNGSEFPVEISLSPLEIESGLLIAAAIRDITDRKAAEADLVAARKEAERANRAKSAFLAAASHDLRQPLQTLSLMNTVLARTLTPNTKASEAAAIQEEAIRSMSELLNSLLDIGKLEAGAVKPDIKDCRVSEILERIRSQFSAQAEAKGLKLLLDECADHVRTDPTLLSQIIQNLVANAIRYTEEGHVRLRCPATGATVRIEVEDTGSGIPPEEQQMIFEDFYQVSRNTGARKEGLGLGLSIVRRTADLLGHSIKLESKPGSGSCFIVEVPKGAQDERREPAATAAGLEKTRGRVLIVDDDPAVVQATDMLLRVTGHETIVARNFKEARERLAETTDAPDVIVCDFHLAAGESGPETIRRLRELAGRPIPAILITGDTSAAVSHLLPDIEKCRLLSKPVDGQALLDLIDTLV